MMGDQNKRLDKLIRDHMEIERPSADLSQKIMQRIITEDTLKEEVLGMLIKKYTLTSPSTNFTSRVMGEIEEKESSVFVYKPVISKKVWLMIAVLVTSILVFAFFTMDYQSNQLDYLGAFMGKLDSVILYQLPEVFLSPIVALSLFAMSIFLWIDYFIQNIRNTHNINKV